MDLAKIIIAGKTRNYTGLDAAEIVMARKLGGGGVTIVPFETGTDDEIVAMIQAAHDGQINLQTDGGWAIGDVRTITVNAFTAGGNVSEAQQQVDIVISSFDEYMSCGNVMQFDFKDALAANVRMNSSAVNSGGFGSSEMYNITLPALVEALPLWLKTLLITFNVLGSAGDTSAVIETVPNNKLALRSEIEIFGNISYSKAGEGSQIPYYTTSANRIKKIGHTGNAGRWWERSPEGNTTSTFCDVYTDGQASKNYAQRVEGVAPFGCL